MHPRNKHLKGYDFQKLSESHPPLTPFVKASGFGTLTIDFSNIDAVRALNYALLKHHYNIQHWQFDRIHLCPGVPGRVDYIHYLADLLKRSNNQLPAPGGKVRALDIGTGATCIYPLLGHSQYGWQFVGSDIAPKSIASAKAIVQANPHLSEHIECRLQSEPEHIFKGLIKPGERFDLTLCNPPFHRSVQEAETGSRRKWQNLSPSTKDAVNSDQPVLNFAGHQAELYCPGGELRFVSKMIRESRHFSKQVLWFSSLVAKKENLRGIKLALKKAGCAQSEIINMHQGNKISRFVAWSFHPQELHAHWCHQHFKKSM
ncbi:23S rRNA (adenine(1618)-N(6))-methyltransferase RlmF [Thalassotalea aquiviva]|uniref:23S rRNA (adenine(1618)-N(6))-methyltransferase RlmF n=1 Tax=Thalassotalea aquiviva TaxID=3242415 RepID=UPI00352AE6AD